MAGYYHGSYDDGCPDCGSIDRNHSPLCPRPRPARNVGTALGESFYLTGGCVGLLPGHHHCRHGHVRDCPNQGECELVD